MLDISARMNSKNFECVYSKDFPMNELFIYREYWDAIRKSRSNILLQEPFAGTVGMAMDYIISDTYKGREVNTACTDGEVIVFSPKYLNEKLFVEIQATLEHETWHVGLLHPFRVGKRDHKIANIAADYSVNGIMYNRYPQLVDWEWIYEDRLSKMSFEAVYEIIKGREGNGRLPRGSNGDCPEGNKSPEGNKGETPKDGEKEDKPEGTPEPKDWEKAKHGQFQAVSDDNGNPLTPEEMKERQESHKEFLNNTRSISVSCGYEAGGEADRHINKITSPKINWKMDISRFVSTKGKRAGSNPMRYSRQKIKHDIFYPASRRKAEINLGIGLDVSSSMDAESLDLLISALEDVRKGNNIKNIEIVPFTTGIIKKNIVNVKKGEKMPKKFSGWGGTRFRPVFKYFDKLDKSPDMVIIFTDLGSSDYGPKPKYPVMWASSYPVVEYTTYTNKPPFGRVVEIEP